MAHSSSLNIFLDGKIIALRPISQENIPFYASWVNNPKNRKFIPYHYPTTLEIRKCWFDAINSNPFPSKIVLEIYHLHDQKVIGYSQIDQISSIHRTGELGLIIGENEYWGKGIGSEVISLLEEYAFSQLNLRKLKAQVIEGNMNSHRVFEKLNYHLEAIHKKDVFYLGEYRDVTFYAKFRN